jgi:hypothetical protein
MKLIYRYSSSIKLFLTVLILAEGVVCSQERADSLKKHPGFFAGISGGASKNTIINTGILSVSDIISKNKAGYSASFALELGYLFSRSAGISTGIGYNSYSPELLLNTYTNKFTTTDSENETYEKRISGTYIKELQNISFLNVPVCLTFQIPAGRAFGFFLKAGVGLSIPVKHEYNSMGTFTFTGYYPAYNILFHDLPEYGFPSDTVISSRGSLELKPYIIEGMAIAGFQYTLKSKFRISAGVSYSRSLSTISDYKKPENFQLSTDVSTVNSLMGGCKNSVAESLGLKVSFIYILK